MIALVFGVITAATWSAVTLSVAGSTSASTGRAPRRHTHPAVAKNE
jgi:hypothetical protein